MISEGDPSSSANFEEIAVNHIDLEWTVDFVRKSICGQCVLHLTVLKDCRKIVLDADGLKISHISLDGKNVPSWCVDEVGPLGQKITIPCQLNLKKRSVKLLLEYCTSPNASALQFIDAAMTADGRQPFLYSQCQPILARSLLPCMDTPSIKQTYSAKVRIPDHGQLVCLMSALSLGKQILDGQKIAEFSFEQPIPIPSNLLAIVVGVLEKRELSERCVVWAEPSLVDQAAWEFAETEQVLQTAEQLLGQYRWGRYDIVVMPPFFPYGGMENPCLTFVAPSIISGDRSMVGTVVHEIAHSWTGNLVTNCNWEHFWLNEGFTVFVERKIIGRLCGEPVRQFEHLVGWEDNLMNALHVTYHPDHEYTKLIPSLRGVHPDDAFSHIPYEKGAAFLLHLEQTLGTTEDFEQFLRAYIEKFAGKSIDTEHMKTFLYSFFDEKRPLLDSIKWSKWLYGTGVPPVTPSFDAMLTMKCKKMAKKCLEVETFHELDKMFALKYQQMATQQKIKLFNILEKEVKGSAKKKTVFTESLRSLNANYGFSTMGNMHIRRAWLILCLSAGHYWAIRPALDLATQCGNFSTALYKRLFGWEESRPMAVDHFLKNQHKIHPANARTIREWIGPENCLELEPK